MKLRTHLSFNGNTREALEFYAEILGGKITTMLRYRDTPAAEYVSPQALDAIMHGCVEFDQFALMGADATPDHPYQGIAGASVVLETPTIEEAERVFAALAQKGQIIMPIQETFWAQRFGMTIDRFGVPWIINGAML